MASIDSYLSQAFAAAEESAEQKVQEGLGRPEKILLPMLIQVSDPAWTADHVPDCQLLSQIDDIISCVGSIQTLEALRRDAYVIAIEASRPALEETTGGPSSVSTPVPVRDSVIFVKADRIHHVNEYGKKALIGIVDAGIDVLHEAFLDDQGNTRILAVWDQRGTTGPSPKLGGKFTPFGTEHTEHDINGYIQQYRSIGGYFSPPGLGRDADGHGTHVASIAAGRAVGSFTGGVAPEAKLVVVIPKSGYERDANRSLGYSTSHQAALQYIANLAASHDLPVVVNLSAGMNGGAHDGTSLLESSFNDFSAGGRKPGYVIVKSAGNVRQDDCHAKLRMARNGFDALQWESINAHTGPDTVEVWCKGNDELAFQLVDPSGSPSGWISRTHRTIEMEFPASQNACKLAFTRYYRDNGDSRLLITVTRGQNATITTGVWRLEIRSQAINTSGDVEAWIERGRDIDILFIAHQSPDTTLTVPGTAATVITVGSVPASQPYQLASYSAYGPTRDGRNKPDLSAPGEKIEAAKGGTLTGVRIESGTSMAAPHVTGTVALVLSQWEARRALNPGLTRPSAAQIRSASSQLTQNYSPSWHPGMGFGVLDAQGLWSAFF